MHLDERSRLETLPQIVIPANDYDRLATLAEAAERNMPQIADYLIRELDRAQVVADEECDEQIVRVGSHVTYRDEFNGRERTVMLVWPHDVDVNRSRISVLTLIGAALLGMKPLQSIEWPSPVGGPRKLTVLAVYNSEMPDPAA